MAKKPIIAAAPFSDAFQEFGKARKSWPEGEENTELFANEDGSITILRKDDQGNTLDWDMLMEPGAQ